MSLSDLKVGAKLQQTLERGNIFLHIRHLSENWSKSILNATTLSSNQLNQLNLYFLDLSGVANGVVISNCFGNATQLPEIQQIFVL
jgi:endo-beta-N-acetylglucosaminidase D